jgi:arginyl-tRNA synthetase
MPVTLEAGERQLVSKLNEFSEVARKAVEELAPHLVCTYLYELAQTFNRFYEHNRVVGDPRESERLYLIDRYAAVLKQGLDLLGIHAPEEM